MFWAGRLGQNILSGWLNIKWTITTNWEKLTKTITINNTMNKQQKIDFVEASIDWYNRMTAGLGHQSWWYTNRSSDDCINVKLHNGWVDINDVLEGLTTKEKEDAEVLGIDLEELVNNIMWGDYGIVDDAKHMLETELVEKYRVVKLEYGGRRGGWLAVVFDWESIDDFENCLDEAVDKIKEAKKENQEVITLVEKRCKELEAMLNNPDTYIEIIKERIQNIKEHQQERAKKILEL